jgi:hypothetical protein
MAIVELLFILLKAIVLSVVYATIILLFATILLRKKIIKKTKMWLRTHLIIFIMLLGNAYFFHDTGIGDNSRIPIGYGQAIQNEDFVMTYFFPDLNKIDPNKDAIGISKYVIINNKICAQTSSDNSDTTTFDFFVYDLPLAQLSTFDKEEDYNHFAKTNKLPPIVEFFTFDKHFQDFIDSRPMWRRWLVP